MNLRKLVDREILSILKDNEFELIRSKRHLVFRQEHTNIRYVHPKTTSDSYRANKNAKRVLFKLLNSKNDTEH